MSVITERKFEVFAFNSGSSHCHVTPPSPLFLPSEDLVKHTETIPSSSFPQTQADIALGALKLGLGVPARLGPPPLDLTEVTVAFLVVVNPDNHVVGV